MAFKIIQDMLHYRQCLPDTLRNEVMNRGLRVNPPHTGVHVVVTLHVYTPDVLPVTVRVLL